MNFAFYYFLFTLMRYSMSTSSSSPSHPSTVFGRSRLRTMKNKALASVGAYCKSVYTAKETEELLDFASKYYPEQLTWWKRYNGFGQNVENPLCSAFPNPLYPKRNKLASVPISRNKFFQRRNIEIPIQAGTMQSLSNEFQYVQRDPVQRPVLECGCDIVGDAIQEENVCADGIVYLSRGLCADMSFFVHAVSPSGSLNVVAHIFFIRPKTRA